MDASHCNTLCSVMHPLYIHTHMHRVIGHGCITLQYTLQCDASSIYTHTYAQSHRPLHVHMIVCSRSVCVCVCVCVCVHVRLCICVCVHTFNCVSERVSIYLYLHVYINIYIYIYIYCALEREWACRILLHPPSIVTKNFIRDPLENHFHQLPDRLRVARRETEGWERWDKKERDRGRFWGGGQWEDRTWGGKSCVCVCARVMRSRPVQPWLHRSSI